MSQRALLEAMDQAAFAAFHHAGMADAATYTPPGGGTAVACTVLVDREAQDFGEGDAPVSGQRVAVALQLAEVSSPAKGGLVVIGTGISAERWVLYREIKRDESRAYWVVRP